MCIQDGLGEGQLTAIDVLVDDGLLGALVGLLDRLGLELGAVDIAVRVHRFLERVT